MQKKFEIVAERDGAAYWKLSITPADNMPLSSPTIVDVHPAAIVGMNYNYEYDDYPVGMPTSPVLELTFNLEFCPTDLVKTLFEPFAIAGTIHTGTHIFLNIWIDGVQGMVFEGIQKTGGASQYDAAANTLTVEFYHFTRVLFENYAIADLNGYDGFPKTTPDNYLIDIIAGASNEYVTFLKGIDSIEYATILDIETYLSARLGALAKLFRREPESPPSAYTFNLPLPDFYASTGTGVRGAALEKWQYGLVVRLIKGPDVVGGAFHVTDGIAGEHRNLWDWMSDHVAGSLRRGVLAGSSYSWQNIFTSETFTIDDYYILGKPEIDWRYSYLKTSSVENRGAVADDITESVHSWGGSRAESTLSNNILLNNLPTQTKFKIGIKIGERTYFGYVFNPFKIYNTTTTRPERVHEYANYDLGDGRNTDTLVPRGTVDYISNITRYLPAVIQQQQGGMIRTVSAAYKKILSSDKQAKIKMKIRNEGLKFEIFNPIKALSFDASVFTPRSIDGEVTELSAVLPPKYYITSVDVDFIKDETEIELFGYGSF